MNCEKIQELILTDYLDGEMDGKQKKVIVHHLAHCTDCQNFMMIAKETVNELFSNIESINPDAFLWYRIKGLIEAEKESQRQAKSNRGILAMMRERYRILVPALALTIIVIVVIWTDIITIKHPYLYKTGTTDLSPEVSFGMHYDMEDESVEYALMKNVNFETAIEEYFL